MKLGGNSMIRSVLTNLFWPAQHFLPISWDESQASMMAEPIWAFPWFLSIPEEER